LNTSDQNKRRHKPAERVSLTSANVELLDKLLRQVQESLPELKLGKNDVVNWLLKTHGDKFSERQLAAIERDYFDPIKALESAITEAKKQQEMGGAIDVQALISNKLMVKRRRPSTGNSRRKRCDIVDHESAKASLDQHSVSF
jgi:hypothetical protein